MKRCPICNSLVCTNKIHEPSARRPDLFSLKTEIIGFSNGWGESNCFLNSALQILFHLPAFRTELLQSTLCTKSTLHYCLYCGLQEILSKYSDSLKYSLQYPIDISRLRKELAMKYIKSGEFEIDFPGDCMEALLALLTSIHSQAFTRKTDSSDTPCSPKCPSHRVFELSVEETIKCVCGARSKRQWDYSTFAHHFYVNEIFEDVKANNPNTLLLLSEEEEVACMEVSSVMKCEGRLHEYMRGQWAKAEIEICPKECAKPRCTKVLKLLTTPKVFMVNMIWKDFRPDVLKILQVYASIPYSISLDSVYDESRQSIHVLKSIIMYGSGHYISAVRTTHKKLWYKIDDESHKVMGEGTWKDLILDSIKSRFYPVGLFYEESSERESHLISSKVWIETERKVIETMKTLYTDTDTDDDWKCDCGQENAPGWKLCKKCLKIRPDIKGWVCSKCTFINENSDFRCESCGLGNRAGGQVERNWKCEKCGKLNSEQEPKCSCEIKSCKICGKKTCTDCFLGFECKVCQNYIPKKDGLICYKCKQKSVSRQCQTCDSYVFSTQLVCQDCTSRLWRCLLCKKFNFPQLEQCASTTCHGKKPTEPKNFNMNIKNNQVRSVKLNGSSKTVSQTPDTCIGCTSEITAKGFFCLNCKIRTIQSKCKFCQGLGVDNLCEDCVMITNDCRKCKKKYFSGLIKCPYC